MKNKPPRRSANATVATEWRGWRIATPAFIGLLAALMLLWGLDSKYLWQDEAATAVLATRMLRFGKPLAYDGVNLITTDQHIAQDLSILSQRTASPKAAIDYYIRRGELKPDTTWKWQPWGSFAVCALSLEVLGKTTLAARLPFALAGIVAVLLLYQLVLSYCNSRPMAFYAALFLIFNSFWILHGRQCRYYSLSSLFLLVTVFTYLRWQQGRRWGAVLFVLAGWIWFQCDYGTVWPVWAVLFTEALIAQRRNLWRPIAVGLALAMSIAPFAYYYELWGRRTVQDMSWWERWQFDLFLTNEYIAPTLVVLGACAVLVWRWKKLPEFERRLVAISCGIIPALSLWVPSVAPSTFLRYLVMAAPIGCLLGGWVLVRLTGRHYEFALVGAAIFIATPWLSLPQHPFMGYPEWYENGIVVRPEVLILAREVFGHRDDPNRETVEWLRKNTAPSDEILINYEDIPLMFYLPNPIRGGIAAFRVEDDAKTPPSVAVMRRSVAFYPGEVFQRELRRYKWSLAAVEIPDVIWGNNPDPQGAFQPAGITPIVIQRRVVETGGKH